MACIILPQNTVTRRMEYFELKNECEDSVLSLKLLIKLREGFLTISWSKSGAPHVPPWRKGAASHLKNDEGTRRGHEPKASLFAIHLLESYCFNFGTYSIMLCFHQLWYKISDLSTCWGCPFLRNTLVLNKFVSGKSSCFFLANLCFAGVPNKEPKMDRSKKYFSSSIYYFIFW